MEWLAIKTIASLVFVLFLMGVVLYVLKKYLFSKTLLSHSGVEMRVVGSLSLQPKKTIQLIKVVNKFFVVGITDQSISPIAEISDEETRQLLENVEQSHLRSTKSFSEYFSEHLGFIGWRKGKSVRSDAYKTSSFPD